MTGVKDRISGVAETRHSCSYPRTAGLSHDPAFTFGETDPL